MHGTWFSGQVVRKKMSLMTVSLALAMLLAPLSLHAQARTSFSIVRDAEIENILRTWATPLFKVAGVAPNSVAIYLINDPSLNAFVTAGPRLFIHTGLLIRSEGPDQVIGVMAHEIGHIAGGHTVRFPDAIDSASTEAIIGTILGVAAAAASGRGDVGAAIAMGGAHVAERRVLAYSRGQEAAADQAGLGYLDKSRRSARGLLDFMKALEGEDLLATEKRDPYVLTHPLTRERIDAIQAFVDRSPNSSALASQGDILMHQRMRGKLIAFLAPPANTLKAYAANDPRVEARYARAIAFYRRPDLSQALPLIDKLISEYPKDPYFHELKGQMLFENGRGSEAIAPYKEAVRLMPNSALLRVGLAQAEIETNNTAMIKDAQAHLNRALSIEQNSAFAWRLLAIAYGRQNDEGMSAYALAEFSMQTGKTQEALQYALRAEQLLSKKSPAWLRTQDIKREAKQIRERRR